MPEPQSGFGFVVSPNSSMAPRLQLNNPEIFGVINRDYIERAFYAAFIWTDISPKLGAYEATATVTITFR